MVCHTIQSERKIKDSTSAIIRTCTANQLKSWSDGGRDLARQCGSRDGLLACAEVGLAIGTALGFLDDDGNIIEFDFYAATRGHLGGEATAAEGRRIGESFGLMGFPSTPMKPNDSPILRPSAVEKVRPKYSNYFVYFNISIKEFLTKDYIHYILFKKTTKLRQITLDYSCRNSRIQFYLSCSYNYRFETVLSLH